MAHTKDHDRFAALHRMVEKMRLSEVQRFMESDTTAGARPTERPRPATCTQREITWMPVEALQQASGRRLSRMAKLRAEGEIARHRSRLDKQVNDLRLSQLENGRSQRAALASAALHQEVSEWKRRRLALAERRDGRSLPDEVLMRA